MESNTDVYKDWHDQLKIIKQKLEEIIRQKDNEMSRGVGILNYHLEKSDKGFGNVEIPREVLEGLIKRLSDAADPPAWMDVDYFRATNVKTHTDE